jgi:hypothetical protein
VAQHTNLPDFYFYFYLSPTQYFIYQGSIVTLAALQRHNAENFETTISRKGIARSQFQFPHVFVRDLCIPMVDLPILLQEICEPILGIYNMLTGI